jgi:hypothetical protein
VSKLDVEIVNTYFRKDSAQFKWLESSNMGSESIDINQSTNSEISSQPNELYGKNR